MNDDLNERIPLAPLTSAMIDEGTLQALFDDLIALTAIELVQVKGGPTDHAGAYSLDDGRRAFQAGARGLQVRYRWQGDTWMDTVMRTPDGTRIVRIRLPNAEGHHA